VSGTVRRSFGAAVAVHLISAVVFLALLAADLEGCDRGDGAWLALVSAIALDLVLAAAVLVTTITGQPGQRRAVLLGWAAGLIPALAGVLTAAVHLGESGTGCPI